jgi:hypothetical protein
VAPFFAALFDACSFVHALPCGFVKCLSSLVACSKHWRRQQWSFSFLWS